MSRIIVAAFPPFVKTVVALQGRSLHRGWGGEIEWADGLNDGLKKASAEKKHMMVIVHKMSCPACAWSKHWFSRSRAIAEVSRDLVMVNLEPWEIPRGPLADKLAPDGHYVPRMLFLSPGGQVLRGVRANMRGDYGYVYMDEHTLVHNMKKLAAQESGN